VAIAIDMNTRPIENSTWSSALARYSRWYSVRSSRVPTTAETTKAIGSVTRKGTPMRFISTAQV